MNIAKIIREITEKLNDENGCGFCWDFVMAGRRDYFNLYKPKNCEDACCVVVSILRNQVTTGFDTSNGFTNRQYRDWNIEMFVGAQSRLDIQFHNEVRSNEEQNSKWEKILYPIYCCIANIDTTICDAHNCCSETSVDITQWNMDLMINFSDQNYDGWMIRATFREWTS